MCAFQQSGFLSTFHPHGVFLHFLKFSQCTAALNLVLYALRTTLAETRLHCRHGEPVFQHVSAANFSHHQGAAYSLVL